MKWWKWWEAEKGKLNREKKWWQVWKTESNNKGKLQEDTIKPRDEKLANICSYKAFLQAQLAYRDHQEAREGCG